MKQEFYDVSPFYKHHLDAILYFGRNVAFYKLELTKQQIIVSVYPDIFSGLINFLTGLSRRELILDYSQIREINLVNKTLYLGFIKNGQEMSYGIYHPENKLIFKTINNRLYSV
jgi:hypothetical protein